MRGDGSIAFHPPAASGGNVAFWARGPGDREGIYLAEFTSLTRVIDTTGAMDGNDDGAVDIGDAIGILAYLFAGGTPPAAPYPGCGTDPTEDTLTCESLASCR